jgi:hypothetical protein
MQGARLQARQTRTHAPRARSQAGGAATPQTGALPLPPYALGAAQVLPRQLRVAEALV